MSDIVIKVENLSKSYIIGHQRQEGYTSLRDVMADSAKSLAHRLTHPFTRHASRVTDSQEEFYALRDVSFEIKQGDRVGIIGRNGAGKSTLLKILSRITEPSSGRITLKGRVASLLEVGTGFHPELTGRENIYLNGAILGMSRVDIKRKFDEIVAFAEVERFLDTPVKRYSSGMYVRLAFAVAAHLEPEILIVDEVLAVGDTQFQKKCLGKMEEVGKEGRTVLFVSHNMPAIQNLCSRSLLLDQGELIFSGKINETIEVYLNRTGITGKPTSPGTFDLNERVNPNGHELIAQRLTLRGTSEPKGEFEMGTDMTIEIDVLGLSSRTSAEVGFIIKDKHGKWLTSVNSGMLGGLSKFQRSNSEKFKFKINALNLTADNYFIDISIAQRGVGRIDYVEHAGMFSVIPTDIYGTGYELSAYFGYFYLNTEMTLDKN